MSRSVILGILSMVLILSLSMTSCVQSESSFWSTYIPKSSYQVDIIGYATVADEVIANGTEVFPPSEEDFWVLQLKIRNKSYKVPLRLILHGPSFWKVNPLILAEFRLILLNRLQ